MSDRELLEAAARAAGIELRFLNGETPFSDGPGRVGVWNPLTDDGDALRLAVRLRMKIATDAHPTGFVAIYSNDSFLLDTHEPIVHGDTARATRLAIVRAAAAIGNKLEKSDE